MCHWKSSIWLWSIHTYWYCFIHQENVAACLAATAIG
jgi:hypothetical protein